jgi:tRNA A-37 threonylcarbamoyl transferase component Bud32/tetratricopeptide (TPR) repeat protein
LESIGKYRILRILGRGGMGTVYEALDPLINRKVAVKMMIPGLAQSPELRQRFLREAQAAGGLRHRNIVTVYDLGEDQGQPFIAMEYLEGTDLEKVIQGREPHPLEWKLHIIRQICDGLAYAHRNGIVHRDVKPANIRVTLDGEAKIVDFGIAHLQSSRITKSGLVLGTIQYMSPEQVDGKNLDHRTDIFSVGAIAFELVAYRKPFDGDTVSAVLYKVMHQGPDVKAFPRTEYSPGLEAIVMRALERDVDERYLSLDEMRDDIDRLLKDVTARRQERLAAAGTAARPPSKARPEGAPVESPGDALREQVGQARAAGQPLKALSLCRRAMQERPGDAEAAALLAEVDAEVRDKEIEQLCGLALSYAADGEVELARKIAVRIRTIDERSSRLGNLEAFLAEEAARRAADALTAEAQELLAQGRLAEACSVADKALAAFPRHSVAIELRDRATTVLARAAGVPLAPQAEAVAPEPPRPELPPAVAGPLSAADEATAGQARPNAEEDRPLEAPSGGPLDDRGPERPPERLAQNGDLDSERGEGPADTAAARSEPTRARVEALTTAALNDFVRNDYPRALVAVREALALDPANRTANELVKILGTLS